MPEPLLSVRNLKTWFHTDDGIVKAVDGVTLDLAPRETLGIVGESGSGKSVTALSIMRLISRPGRIEDGEIRLRGRDLLGFSVRGMRSVRGNDVAMIFQEPMTSLDPLYSVGDPILEALRLHQHLRGDGARQAAIRALSAVGITDPEQRLDSFPHQMSGGMRQRVMIAVALSCDPDLLI